MISKFFHNKPLLILLAIILVGTFLRSFHFSDWMHYELDQARDFRIIHAAIEYGPGELPLQGPRAAGSFLRLGPLFYYMEYVSALIFGDTPAGSVAIILILSILTLPLLYVFLRRFFGWELSLALTGLASVSLFLVTYSRFGWNPNLLPFFSLAFGYCLLRLTDASVETYCNTSLRPGHWLILAAVALAFLTNMHFLAFAAAPLIGVLYLLWTRPRIALRFWVGAVAVFLFLNVPLIVNDVKTGGENTQAFFEAVTAKSDKDTHTFIEKAVRNTGLHAEYYWLILTGYQGAELPQLKGFDIQCDHNCRAGLLYGTVAFLLILAGVVAWWLLYRREEDEGRKNFLRLVALWWCVVFLAYTPLAYNLAPRFFLFNAPLMFVLLGLMVVVLRSVRERFLFGAKVSLNKVLQTIAFTLIALFALANLLHTLENFSQLSRAATDPTLRIPTDRVLKEKTRMTLAQMEHIVDVMVAVHERNGQPIFLHAQAEFKRAFWERIDVRGIPRSDIAKDLQPLYREGNYFVIIRTQSDHERFLEKFLVGMDIVDTQVFGTLTLYQLAPQEAFITDERKEFEPKRRDPRFASGVQVRYLWRQVFEK